MARRSSSSAWRSSSRNFSVLRRPRAAAPRGSARRRRPRPPRRRPPDVADGSASSSSLESPRPRPPRPPLPPQDRRGRRTATGASPSLPWLSAGHQRPRQQFIDRLVPLAPILVSCPAPVDAPIRPISQVRSVRLVESRPDRHAFVHAPARASKSKHKPPRDAAGAPHVVGEVVLPPATPTDARAMAAPSDATSPSRAPAASSRASPGPASTGTRTAPEALRQAIIDSLGAASSSSALLLLLLVAPFNAARRLRSVASSSETSSPR